MTAARILAGALLCTALSLGAVKQSVGLPMMDSGMRTAGDDVIVNVRAARGGGGGARAGGGRSANVSRTNVNRTSVSRTNVNRTNVNVNRGANVTVNVNRNVRVGVRVRPVRAWGARPYYGTIVGGVALGSFIAVSAMGVAPVAPAPNMCWFWTDSMQMSGYWDYCQAPY
jgi:hypothetical protein